MPIIKATVTLNPGQEHAPADAVSNGGTSKGAS
jgi:hypothetical protein